MARAAPCRPCLWLLNCAKLAAPRDTHAEHDLSKENDDDLPEESIGDAWEAGLENGAIENRRGRFASPIVDDQGLIIADALVAGIVAPGLEIITCTALGFPLPSWSAVFGANSRRRCCGRGMSTCWFGGALSARLYARDAYDFPPPNGADDRFAVTFKRTLQAGAFATASSSFRRSFDYCTFGFWPQLGDSPASDAEICAPVADLVRTACTGPATMGGDSPERS